MVHPATERAVRSAIAALGVPLDIGFVFPPKPGEQRGYGQWTNGDLDLARIMAMLPRAAAANARGGNVYMRLGSSVKDSHPGIVMLDDLNAGAVDRLSRDGFEPCLVVQTSSGNFQTWVRLIDVGSVPYAVMGMAARHLALSYGGDQRAVSPRQPGRLPGFTNRKPKHQQVNGSYPFVRLIHAEPGLLARAGANLIGQLASTIGTAGAAAGAAPETPRIAADPATGNDQEIMTRLDAIHAEQLARIQREVAEGRRPVHAASLSEVDFATAVAAIGEGVEEVRIAAWIAQMRPDKDVFYSQRTLDAARSWDVSGRHTELRR